MAPAFGTIPLANISGIVGGEVATGGGLILHSSGGGMGS